jgi:hypothetical protein
MFFFLIFFIYFSKNELGFLAAYFQTTIVQT